MTEASCIKGLEFSGRAEKCYIRISPLHSPFTQIIDWLCGSYLTSLCLRIVWSQHCEQSHIQIQETWVITTTLTPLGVTGSLIGILLNLLQR